MHEKTDIYVRGMEAINNFYSMLYDAMLEGMPGEKRILPNGAYGWRGYQIDQYQNLARGQYYCQVYPGNPDQFLRGNGTINSFTCRELVFQEAYEDSKHTPIDEREQKHCIQTGNYYYPFQVSLDLYRSRFFLLNKEEQFAVLKTFVSCASDQALIWHRSNARLQVTNSNFLEGKEVNRKPPKSEPFGKVNVEFLDIWGMQDDLFTTLKKILRENASKIIGKDIRWLWPNANINNFDFRGYRLKFENFLPGNRFDYLWAIYFKEPKYKFLGCFTPEKRLIHNYNLEENAFFDLACEEQDKELMKFVTKCLKQ
jgi:hypothetical protein